MLRLITARVPLVLPIVFGARLASTSPSGFQSLPKFEIHDVRDDPAEGTMTRVAVDGKLLLISQYPQLGPRKVDPNDLSPQFDADRRISVRMRHVDLAYLVSVCENRLPRHQMHNRAYTLEFEKLPEGYRLHGKVHRVASQKMEDWSVNFDKHFAVTLEHFLQSALTESFGFRQHYAARALDVTGANLNDNNTNVGSVSGGGRRRQQAGAGQTRRQ